jgi:hypothetical protein
MIKEKYLLVGSSVYAVLFRNYEQFFWTSEVNYGTTNIISTCMGGVLELLRKSAIDRILWAEWEPC